jgi:vitamin B12/bleomycin/antimicrobial peptide transport system ATP-binding/permease protein
MMSFLVERESENYLSSFYKFLFFLLLFLSVYALNTYLQDRLGIIWREQLTNLYFNSYLNNKNYYYLQIGNQIDNPDQRISEDINSFVNKSISIFFLIFDSFLQLFAYSILLWDISKILFFIAVVLSILTNFIGITFFGKKLTIINKEKYELEANLRFSLIELRENSETIALSNLEVTEKKSLLNSLYLILENTKKLIILKSGLIFFQLGSKNIITVIPTLYLAGKYISKEIPFGIIEQGSVAFVTLLYSLTVISDQLQQISILQADSKRLVELNENFLDDNLSPSIVKFEPLPNSNYLQISNFQLFTQNNKVLFALDSLVAKNSDHVLITGESGSGKTTFLKCLANLHSYSIGSVQMDNSKETLFLPQNPFFTNRSLISQIVPNGIEITEEELREIYFPLVNLPSGFRYKELVSPRKWNILLSNGEKQKLEIIKIFIASHFYYFLDESTSSLDEQSIVIIYSNFLKKSIGFHSISHNPLLRKFHTLSLEINDQKCNIQNLR